MNFKRIHRSPILWVVLGVLMFMAYLSFSGSNGYTKIDTSVAEKLIADKAVEEAKFVGEDRLDLTLKPGKSYSDGDKVKDPTNKVQTLYVVQRGEELVDALRTAAPPKGYTDDPPQQNW